MSSVVYLFGSGIAFFAGAAIVLSAIAISFVPVRFSRPAARICAWVGFVLIALSAAPLPYWWYG
jgi:hypothetical protein